MSELEAHLERQERLLRALANLLAQERKLLGRAHVDGAALDRIAGDKRERFLELEGCETQRRQAQRQLGYADDADGARRAAEAADCLILWRAVQKAATEVAHRNRLNGDLIDIRLAHNQRMLEFFQALTGGGLYGPDGRSRHGGARLASQA